MDLPRPRRVFLSYAHADGLALALRLEKDLTDEGIAVWLDRTRLLVGSTWSREIERAVDASDVVIALLSRAAFDSDICRGEHLRSLRKGKRVIPILVQPDIDRPVYLEASQYLDFSSSRSYQRALKRLLTAMLGEVTATLAPAYSTVPSLPLNFVERAVSLGGLRSKIIGPKRAPVLGVAGMGGAGKTILVQALCRDRSIQTVFRDGVVWFTLGQAVNDVRPFMGQLANGLGAAIDVSRPVSECAGDVQRLLENRSVLVVLDDVWSVEQVRPFCAAKGLCQVVFTSRDTSIATALRADEYRLGMMSQDEARQLLAHWSGRPVPELPIEAAAIIDATGGLPLAVSIVGALVGDRPERWRDASQLLRRGGLFSSGVVSPIDYRHRTLRRAFRASLGRLIAEDRERYKLLATVPEDVSIPERALDVFWNTSKAQTRTTVERLVEMSLIQRAEDGSLRLHDLQRQYLQSAAGTLGLRQLHRRLIAGYHQRCRGQWAAGPDDGYFFAQFAYHLEAAGHKAELNRLAVSARWLQRRLDATDATGVVADVVRANSRDARFVADVIRRAMPILVRDKRQLASQLIGRTPEPRSVRLARTLDEAGAYASRPWLRPLHAFLAAPDSPVMHTLRGHSFWVTDVAISADGNIAVSAGDDATMRLWDLTTGTLVNTFEHSERFVAAVSIDATGRVAVSSDGQRLRVWDLEKVCEAAPLKGNRGMVHSIALTADGELVASGSSDGKIRVWNIRTGGLLRVLRGHSDRVRCLAINGDGTLAVSGSNDGTVRLWNLRTGKLHSILGRHPIAVEDVDIDTSGRRSVSSCGSGMIRVWDHRTGGASFVLQHGGLNVPGVSMTGDGRRAISGSMGEGTVDVWDIERRVSVQQLIGHSGGVRAVDVTPDGRKAISASEDFSLKVWRLSDRPVRQSPEGRLNGGHSRTVNDVAISDDGTRAVSVAWDSEMRVWNVRNRSVQRIINLRSSAHAVALTRDGSVAFTGSDDQVVRAWSVASGQQLSTIRPRRHSGRHASARSLALTQDGQRLLCSSGCGVEVFSTVTGRQLHRVGRLRSEVTAVGAGGNGVAICGCFDGTAVVFDLKRPSTITTLQGHWTSVYAVAVSRSGRTLATADSDGILNFWDLHTKTRRTVRHDAWIHAVALTVDERYALSVSADQVLRMWDCTTAEPVAALTCDDPLGACAISVKGDVVVLGNHRGGVSFVKFVRGRRGPGIQRS